MANRRKAHCGRRRAYHTEMRHTSVFRQENESSAEGPNDSPKAQKARKNLKARKA